jgi:receptor expression-enhancing protein 1/2/3/4
VNVVDGEDRLTFIAAQRERLSILLSALDKEASTLQGNKVGSKSIPLSPRTRAYRFMDGANSSEEDASDRPQSSASGLSTRKSENDFEKIEAESGTEEIESQRQQTKRAQSGSWMPWSWGAKSEKPAEVRQLFPPLYIPSNEFHDPMRNPVKGFHA